MAFKTDRRTKYVSIHSSYWDSRKTNGQPTFHLSLNLRKTNEQLKLRQTDKLFFLPRYWNRHKDNRRPKYVSFYQLCWHWWQTDKIRFISLLILGFKEDRRTTYVSFNPQSKQDKRTIELRLTDKPFFFHPRYWNRCKTNRRTNYASFHPLCWHYDRQTDKIRFISLLIFGAEQERQTHKNILFHSSYWNPRKTNYLAFNPHILIYARQTDNRIQTNFISPLLLGFKQDGHLILESTQDR